MRANLLFVPLFKHCFHQEVEMGKTGMKKCINQKWSHSGSLSHPHFQASSTFQHILVYSIRRKCISLHQEASFSFIFFYFSHDKPAGNFLPCIGIMDFFNCLFQNDLSSLLFFYHIGPLCCSWHLFWQIQTLWCPGHWALLRASTLASTGLLAMCQHSGFQGDAYTSSIPPMSSIRLWRCVCECAHMNMKVIS